MFLGTSGSHSLSGLGSRARSQRDLSISKHTVTFVELQTGTDVYCVVMTKLILDQLSLQR
jgi:hypothetical protein